MDIGPPECLKTALSVTPKLLMGPGPSTSSPRILQAVRQSVLEHTDPDLFKIMDDIKEGLRYAFQTKNVLTLAISGTGHSGMEAVLSNLLEPGENVLIAITGTWGDRAADMARRYGAIVNTVSSKFGTTLKLSEIEDAVARVRPKLFFIVQGDSSTGVLQPVDNLSAICRRYNCLLAVDVVASLGAVPFYMDRWGIDAAYAGSQKVLGAPPGLAPISFSPRARDVIFSRKTPAPVYYWDMKLVGRQWKCFDEDRIYHHTISSTLLYGLREGLSILADEGLEHAIQRHRTCAKRLYNELEKIGFELFVENEDDRLCTVTTVYIPDWVTWDDVALYMRRYKSKNASKLKKKGFRSH
ncbi:unnamed protein product [Acanthoscelides obtectus]|uniref:Alanine--glyoxylate aminotransferase n=1 Tax=Acanthoscelides obtectus TaxID=200917 RepID=A0A9P0M5S0_ACAOB|nr:unnamed protein product [Acanthoscelides obtectus]CAK1626507.1 Serine--pyruvate aminotransferase, mitochondrial [Acanthoscelides obtectus]